MSRILTEVLEASGKYAANLGEKGKLPLPPARSFAILTCMDARLDPAKYAGLAEGDAHVMRNAGGRAGDDAPTRHRLLSTMLSAYETIRWSPNQFQFTDSYRTCIRENSRMRKMPRV
jgi:carbonic anhydrase